MTTRTSWSRDKKDPRDIRILDPACGSGHFLLYAFDLLETIYEEAWHDDASPPSSGDRLDAEAGLPRSRTSCAARCPALILEHNLFGVEIDPRAAQIAALALWLRAQRAYRRATRSQLRSDRASHERTSSWPSRCRATRALVDTFAATSSRPCSATCFDGWPPRCASPASSGTLLRVDDAIATTLTQAREEYVRQATTQHLPGLEPERRQEELDFSEIDDVRFFEEAEAMLLDALRRFSESAGGGGGVRRWLFADDAAQGIALIELVRRRFDVVLMNPPFGACSLPAKKEFEKSYPRTKNDLYAAFVERGIELLEPSRPARSDHLANRLLPVELPEVARGDSARRKRRLSSSLTSAMASLTARWSRSQPTASRGT